MTAADFNTNLLAPGLAWFTRTVGSVPPVTTEAHLLLLAIAGQESGWQNIPQGGGGPGRGPWQFEPETCAEIIDNPASASYALKLNEAAGLSAGGSTYETLLSQPRLAAGFARLDLWCNPKPLPTVGDQDGAWQYYLATWRPGKPRPDDWPENYQAAMAALRLTAPTSGAIS